MKTNEEAKKKKCFRVFETFENKGGEKEAIEDNKIPLRKKQQRSSSAFEKEIRESQILINVQNGQSSSMVEKRPREKQQNFFGEHQQQLET